MTLSLAAAVTATAVTGIAIWISHLTEWPHPALAAELIGRAGTVHLLLTLLVLAPLLALLPTRRTPLAGARAWATPPLAAAVTTGLVLLLLVL